ncbi:MAG: hypothetical protein COA78_02975 [Blastopirellula sp.]|nr:MAG: hypothetical protein COA78_02975 [Blastopirellula sp.]
MLRGKPNWFRPKTIGWGLTPVTWQGWLYTLYWALFLCVPFTYFLATENFILAGVWEVCGIGYLSYDAYCILQKIKEQENNQPQ